MIRIQNILPLGAHSEVELSSIHDDYCSLVTPAGKTSPLTEVEKAVAKRTRARSAERKAQLEFLNWVKKNYREILVGEPLKLTEFIKEVSKEGWEPLLRKGKRLTKFGEEVEKMFSYKDRFTPTRKWLAQQLNIKSCPYCNAQYTLVVEDHDNEIVAKLQFDHFFPKKKFPYLSISLYNLIPACANCNLAKRDDTTALNTHYHPYHSALASSARFAVKWNKRNVLSSLPEMRKLKPEDIEVMFVSKYSDKEKLVEDHDRMFGITGVYKRHTDVAQELLERAVLYTEHYKESLDKIEGLFPDRKVMMRYILGNYMEEERMLDRPLAKFTQDIATSLGLIDEK